MKKQINLEFFFASVSVKPCCQATDQENGEILACAIRDSWEEAERVAKKEIEKHYSYGPVPSMKTIEIEIEDSWPDNVVELK